MTGAIINTPNCCAVRASLVREEMTIAAYSDTSAEAGPTANTNTAVRKSTIAPATPGSANTQRPPKYTARPANVMRSVGTSVPSTFATSRSRVPMGAASNGSSVLACYSPTTACAASAIAPVIGVSKNNIRNC